MKFQTIFSRASCEASTFSLCVGRSCLVWFPGGLPGYCSSLDFVVAFPGSSLIDGASFVECVVADGFGWGEFPVWVDLVIVEVGTGG